MIEPKLTQVTGGWAAHGDGWAVHGQTRDEALRLFGEALKRHAEIDAQPYWSEVERPNRPESNTASLA